MTGRLLSGMMLGAVLLCGQGAVAQEQEMQRPNILFIFSDDHALQAISAYQDPHRPNVLETPHIDRIAREGILFTRSYNCNAICGPSRATILTGLHSHANRQLSNHIPFDGSQQTFPKLLQKAGYRTAIRGKWHLRTAPTGFDSWMVYSGQGEYFNPKYKTDHGDVRLDGYSADRTTDLGIEYLEEQAKQPEKPFFLAVQFKAPHRPFLPPLRYLGFFKGKEIPEPKTLFDDYEGRASALKNQDLNIRDSMTMSGDLKVFDQDPPYYFKGWFDPEEESLQTYLAYYRARTEEFHRLHPTGDELVRWKWRMYMEDILGAAKAVDDNVGRLLDALDRLGLSENTLVVYSSDQGFYLGEHGWFDKRWMFEESYQMPLMMRLPGRIQPGTRCDALVQNIDYAPTFLELAGTRPEQPMHGRSLTPLFSGTTPSDWRDYLYYHYYEYPKWHNVEPHYGVSNKRYKLIHFYRTDEWEMTDLLRDPLEMTNVCCNPDYREIRAALYQELLRLRKQYQVPDQDVYSSPGGPVKLSAEPLPDEFPEKP